MIRTAGGGAEALRVIAHEPPDLILLDVMMPDLDGLEAHHGLEPGGLAGTFEAFPDCIHPDDRELVTDAIETATKSGKDFSFQHRSLWPDGSVRWLNGARRT